MNTPLKHSVTELNQLSFVSVNSGLAEDNNFSEVHDDLSVPLFLNRTLLAAIEQGASDIHFEPYADSFRIRFRLDGLMQEISEMPKGFGHLLAARLKVIAGLDISEQRIAQGGRFKVILGEQNNNSFDFRCSVIPTMHGETIVLRLLYLPENLLQLSLLGLENTQISLIQNAIHRQQGMVLVTGPTGSGKTVSLYTLIKLINRQPRSIYTVEDPIEIDLNGINQISVSDRINFAEAARTILRQDPDVIMLGEMRDQTTLDTAIKAAHTGHLVLSTLHANTAPKAIPRLRNLGVDAYNIASTVTLIISQRLLRRIDPETREEITVPTARLLALGFEEDELKDLTLYRARPEGNHNGYKGRIGVFQVMAVTPELTDLIGKDASDKQISAHIEQQDVQNLRRSALNKVKAGITDIDEVERVLGLLGSAELSTAIPPPANVIQQQDTAEAIQ